PHPRRAGAGRHPRQQRGRRRVGATGPHGSRALAAPSGGQRDRALSVHARSPARHARARVGAGDQHRVHGGARGRAVHRGLLRVKARAGRAHALGRGGSCRARRHGERSVPRLRGHRPGLPRGRAHQREDRPVAPRRHAAARPAQRVGPADRARRGGAGRAGAGLGRDGRAHRRDGGALVRINVLGAGPAGLYFSLLMMRRDPAHRITVFERDAADDTFGWGIVFSERTLAFLRDRDEPTFTAIAAASQTWDNVDVVHRGEKVSIHGNGFSGIARLTFLNILQRRCRELGVDLRFRTPITDLADLSDSDLLLGADGANSLVRRHHAYFCQPSVEVRLNRYVWLGTPRLFHGLVMIFRSNEHGLFIAHAYKFSPTTSTFIVECSPETWARAGFDRLNDLDTCRYLARVFRDDLDGEPLLSNNFVKWVNFPLVRNRRWHHGRTVLAGDAAHTAHFSIGSGTKLALEDAIALADALGHPGRPLPAALAAYEAARKPAGGGLQAAAPGRP